MRRLWLIVALITLVYAGAPFSIAEERQQRLSPTDVALLSQQAESGDPAAMRAMGDAYRDGNGVAADLDTAILWYERAGKAGNSTAIYNMAVVLSERGREGDLARALDALKQVLPAYEESLGSGDVKVGNIHMVLGRIHSDLGQYDEALAEDGKALAIFEKETGASSDEVAKLASNMGIVYERIGRYDEALQSYQRSLGILGHRGGTADLANLYVNLGIVYESLGRLDDALASEQKALRIRARLSGENHAETALVLANMGSTLDRLGRSAEAVKDYEKALPVLAKAYGADHPMVAVNLANLGTIYPNVGRYDEALNALNTALPVLIKGFGPDHPSVAYAIYNLGLVYQTVSRFEPALANLKKALPMFEKIYGTDHPEVAQIHGAIGNVLSELDRNDEALPELEAALPILKKAFGDHLRVATVLNNLGAALHGLNRNQEALAAYDKAIDMKVRISGPGDPDIAVDLVNRGNIYESLGRPDEAIAQTVRALALYGAGETRLDPIRKAYWGLARALDMKGEHRAAIIFAKQAVNAHQELRLRNEKLPADLRSSLARGLRWVYQLVADQEIADGAYSEAQYAGSLIKEEELFDFTTRGSTGGPQPKGQMRLTASEEKFIKAFDALLKSPRKTITEAQRLADKRLKKGALNTKEQARAAILDGELDAAFAALSREATALFANVEAERQAIQAEQLESNAKHGAELQKMLGEFALPVALYQAIATDNALHLFVTVKGHETIHRLVPVKRTELARQVYDAVASVEAHEEQAPKLLAGLYDLLIRPVAADLKASEARVLMLNLSGFLRYVPYAALNSGDRYLIEDYALANYTPAAATEFEAQPREKASGAGFGVTMAHGEFPALPGVAEELEAIFKGGDGLGPLSGASLLDQAFDQASLKAALKKKPRFLHIASHFKFVPGNENDSFLLTGTGAGLTLNTLRTDKGLRFQGVDLLALSACETARGGGSEGEEIESFGVLAPMNGASAVMATLWQIADQSTAKLMSDFYTGMIRDGLDKATALQRAQVAMIRGQSIIQVAGNPQRSATIIADESSGMNANDLPTTHPYYWAPFILMGNWL